MDELKKLKQIWNRTFDDKNQNPVHHAQIEEIIRRESKGPVLKLKRSLRIEIGAILISIPLLIALLFIMPETYFVVNTSIIIVVFTGSLLYFFHCLHKLAKIWRNNQATLKQSIESTLLVFKFYKKFYIRLGIILFTFGFQLGFVFGFSLVSDGMNLTQLFMSEYMVIFLAIIVSLIFLGLSLLGAWYLLKFYLSKLYDVHIEKLEKILHELLENENIDNATEL